jgi:hypothetical protein
LPEVNKHVVGSIIDAGETFLPFFYDRRRYQGFQEYLIEESGKKLRPGLFLITEKAGFREADIQVREVLNLINGHGTKISSTQEFADYLRRYRDPAQVFLEIEKVYLH